MSRAGLVIALVTVVVIARATFIPLNRVLGLIIFIFGAPIGPTYDGQSNSHDKLAHRQNKHVYLCAYTSMHTYLYIFIITLI